MADPRTINLDEIRSRAAAAAPGPWFWRGNVDNGDPELSRYKPGWGRVEVLRHYQRERTADDPGAKAYDEYLRDSQVLDRTSGEYRHMTDEERTEAVRKDWLEDPWEQPQHDVRMAFVHPELMHALDARELAIFEVCPEATERSDPRIYRADITGIRHPDAEFLAASRQDVDDLLAVIDQVRTTAEAWIYDMEGDGETCLEGGGCPCCYAREILATLGVVLEPVGGRPVTTVAIAGDVL